MLSRQHGRRRRRSTRSPSTTTTPRAELHRLFAFAETPPVDADRRGQRRRHGARHRERVGHGARHAGALDELDDAATGGGLRTIFVALTPAFPKLSTADVESMGLSALGSQFVTYFDPRNTVARQQHRPRRQARRRHRRRARGDVLAERGDGAAHGQPRLRLRAGDRRRQRAAPGGRRRHLPVRDDALQRRVLRRPAGGRARGALALHLALPHRPRRDRGVGQPSTSSSGTTPARAS